MRASASVRRAHGYGPLTPVHLSVVSVPEAKMRLITAAAIKHNDMICSVPRPGRHADVIREMARAGIPIPITGEQGFLTSDGLFVGRELAMLIAVRGEQVKPKTADGVSYRQEHPQLFSEDLW